MEVLQSIASGVLMYPRDNCIVVLLFVSQPTKHFTFCADQMNKDQRRWILIQGTLLVQNGEYRPNKNPVSTNEKVNRTVGWIRSIQNSCPWPHQKVAIYNMFHATFIPMVDNELKRILFSLCMMNFLLLSCHYLVENPQFWFSHFKAIKVASSLLSNLVFQTKGSNSEWNVTLTCSSSFTNTRICQVIKSIRSWNYRLYRGT